MCDRFLWLDLKNASPSDGDFTIVVDEASDKNSFERYVISDLSEILQTVELEARQIELNTLVESLKTISMAGMGYGVYHPFAYMGGYKAVYLLMADI